MYSFTFSLFLLKKRVKKSPGIDFYLYGIIIFVQVKNQKYILYFYISTRNNFLQPRGTLPIGETQRRKKKLNHECV